MRARGVICDTRGTGINPEYWRVFSELERISTVYKNHPDEAFQEVVSSHIKRHYANGVPSYRQAVPDAVITRENEIRIHMLDDLAEVVSGFSNPTNATRERIEETLNHAARLIYDPKYESGFI